LREREVRGAIFRRFLATGTPFLNAIAIGLRPMSSNGSSMQSRMIQTWNTPCHRFDTVGVAPLLKGVDFAALIADKAFDSNSIISDLNERGAKIVISQHPRRAKPIPIDDEMYKWRHLIENFFCKLKEFKSVAMRSDKTDQSFAAIVYLSAVVINSR
jgi:transposase